MRCSGSRPTVGSSRTRKPGSPTRAAAVLALARAEARELVMTIPVLFFFLLEAGLLVRKCWDEEGMDAFPVLNTVDRGTQTAPLLACIALLLSVNVAVLRDRRNGTAHQFGVLPMEPWRRTLAHLLSVVPFVLLTALLVGVDYGWSALKPGAVGHGSLGELAVGPLMVLLAGVAGVLLARLLPSTFVPILFAVAAYLLIVIVLTSDSAPEGVRRLVPVLDAGSGGGDPVPSDLLGRPASWHALYLAGLCALLACAALLVAGGRTRTVKAVTAVVLAATAAGVVGQLPRDTAALEAARRTASTAPERVQSCTTRGGATYCAFPEWNGVRGEWAKVVDRVRSAAGAPASGLHLTVRQRIDLTGGLEVDSTLSPSTTPGEVTVGTRWGGNRVGELAVGVAAVLVAGTEARADALCDGRMVTVMWLALGGDAHPLATFRDLRLDDDVTGSGVVLAPTDPLSLTARQTEVLRALLDRPRAEVTARVKAHWRELTSPRTTTARTARLLGVPVPKGKETCEV
ncbi:AzlD domain-containing protein [Streptomyces galbus]|uniref:AzlD domain-containing protein n=2 Tax=Streptomyces galbus TaxID=33898 RepID=A0ABX1IPI2_STRGB|nr:AzlD domain-containing protein [Streptomyces galbus]